MTELLKFHQLGGGDLRHDVTNIGRWTFETTKVRKEVTSRLRGRVLNACCGATKLRHPTGGEIVRNDLNPEMDADHYYDVTEIDQYLPERSFDVIIFDPPYDQTQSDEHYDGMHASDISASRKALAQLTAPGGDIIEFGWNSVSVSQLSDVRGFERLEIHLWQRGTNLHEVIMTVDRRVTSDLSEVKG